MAVKFSSELAYLMFAGNCWLISHYQLVLASQSALAETAIANLLDRSSERSLAQAQTELSHRKPSLLGLSKSFGNFLFC
jgi:hypothetical protein